MVFWDCLSAEKLWSPQSTSPALHRRRHPTQTHQRISSQKVSLQRQRKLNKIKRNLLKRQPSKQDPRLPRKVQSGASPAGNFRTGQEHAEDQGNFRQWNKWIFAENIWDDKLHVRKIPIFEHKFGALPRNQTGQDIKHEQSTIIRAIHELHKAKNGSWQLVDHWGDSEVLPFFRVDDGRGQRRNHLNYRKSFKNSIKDEIKVKEWVKKIITINIDIIQPEQIPQ